jgi:hypothetical protein
MPRFRVIVVATGMNVPPNGMAGFATTCFVHAPTEQAAGLVALRRVEESIAADPVFARSPGHPLRVHLAERVRNPFRRSVPNGGFTFFADDEALGEALKLEDAAGTGGSGRRCNRDHSNDSRFFGPVNAEATKVVTWCSDAPSTMTDWPSTMMDWPSREMEVATNVDGLAVSRDGGGHQR